MALVAVFQQTVGADSFNQMKEGLNWIVFVVGTNINVVKLEW